MSFKEGDRIVLVRMGSDPDPIEPGATGTIDFVNDRDPHFAQIGVKWDNGRSLMILPEYDLIRKI